MSKLKLTDREWGEFAIGEIFTITIGKSIDGNKVNRQSGKMAYITRKEQFNGIDGFIDYSEDFLNKDYPVITIGNETAEPFVQVYPFFTGTKVNILKPKQSLNASVLSFIATSLRKHKSKYSYSFTINSTRLKKQNILLPIDLEGNPDWQFMEDFIKQKEVAQTEKLIAYYTNRAMELMIQTKTIGNIKWKSFEIGKLFTELVRGNNKSISSLSDGNVPYLGAKYNDNAIVGFVDQKKTTKIFKGNAIVFVMTGEGSVGKAVYKSEDFAPSSNLFVGYLEKLNRWNGLFFVSAINNGEERYSYGYIRNEKRLSAEKIMLPIDNSGNPDWQFMENFIKRIESEKTQAVLNYYNNMKNKEIVEGGVNLEDWKEIRWTEFYISDYFDFIRGNQNNMARCESGDIPLVSAKKVDNGYKAFITGNDKKLFPKNIITLNNDGDGGVGMAYYQPAASALDTHVTALIPKIKMTKYQMLFISQAITTQRDKFSHGYSLNNNRLKAQKILLPVADNNQPDWEVIERIMKKIELEQVMQYLRAKAK